jgi:hypothetical protein
MSRLIELIEQCLAQDPRPAYQTRHRNASTAHSSGIWTCAGITRRLSRSACSKSFPPQPETSVNVGKCSGIKKPPLPAKATRAFYCHTPKPTVGASLLRAAFRRRGQCFFRLVTGLTSRRTHARSGNHPARASAPRSSGRSCRALRWSRRACSGCRRSSRGRPAG